MTILQRVAYVAASVVLAAQCPQDVSGFGLNNPLVSSSSSRQFHYQSTTAIRAEPSASEKAAELRKKAEEAKRKAQELKKVAEEKAEAAMIAVKKANDKQAAESKKEPVAASVPKTPTPPTITKDKASTRISVDASEGAIIPINAETVEFTSGILGGALALALGASPVLAVVAAAAANYVSKKDDLGEISELVQGLSKASLGTLNWFGKLNDKYTILGKLQESLDKAIQDLKNSDGGSAETFKTIEETTKKIQQLADELDVVEGGKQALGAIGEVLEVSIDKAVDANKEYKLTDRAAEAAKKAIDKVKND